jgi:hypothetical protein
MVRFKADPLTLLRAPVSLTTRTDVPLDGGTNDGSCTALALTGDVPADGGDVPG